MKILFYLISLMLTASVYGQNYYASGKQVKGKTEYFAIKHLSARSYKLANSQNIKEDLPINYLDGRSVADNKPTANPVDTKQLKRAIEETFTVEEIQNLKSSGRAMFIGFVVDPRTALTEEVSFVIPNIPVYNAIPPEKFETLEQKIKQYVRWMVPPAAKTVSHIVMSTGYFSK